MKYYKFYESVGCGEGLKSCEKWRPKGRNLLHFFRKRHIALQLVSGYFLVKYSVKVWLPSSKRSKIVEKQEIIDYQFCIERGKRQRT